MSGSPYELLILTDGEPRFQLQRVAAELGIRIQFASNNIQARRLATPGMPVLVLGEPEAEPMVLAEPGLIEVALLGPPEPGQLQAAFEAGAIDWLRDPDDPFEVLRVLSAHSSRVDKRLSQTKAVKTLARGLGNGPVASDGVQTRVAQVVIHEVRNVLGTLEMNVHSLGQSLDETTPVVRETIQDLVQVTRYLSALVGSGSALLGVGHVGGDVTEAVQAVVTMTGTRSGREVLVSLEPDLPPVALPTHQLAQILLNTTLNALHAGAINIQIEAQQGSEGALIAITDDGAGMTATDLSQALERGYTTKKTGTGLGLSICKDLLEAAGGTIHIDSHFGQGTTVAVEIPFKDAV